MSGTRLLAATAVIGLIAAACGGATTDTESSAGVSGSIVISGSSTVLPISSRVGEAFGTQNPNLTISVDGPGTGDGFQLFCAGQTHVSDASRPITDSEVETCAANGVEFTELLIAIDGLSVLTSNENAAISCLSFADLYALLGPEATGFESWADSNDLAAEVGGMFAPYPDQPLSQSNITAPGEESGTYDSFVELVIADFAEERGQEEATRPDYVASPNDNVIIQGVAGSPSSLGWVGYAYYLENTDRVKALGVNGGETPGQDGCVEPTPESIADGSYPLARPLFIYVNADEAASRPELTAFVDYYLSDEGLESVTAAGFVALDDYGPTRQTWEQRVTGPQT